MPVQPDDVCRFLDRSGWSQARLAWEIGVNQPRISRFITGLKRPNPDLQRALDAFFAAGAGGLMRARGMETGLHATAVGPGNGVFS